MSALFKIRPLYNFVSIFSAQEFTELQSVQNDDLTKCCENFFETLDGFAETKNKHRSATWPLQMMLLVITIKIQIQ